MLTVAAAQLGPVQKHHTRAEVVERMLVLLRDAHRHGVELVVYPELALTTFFPRWFVDDIGEADHWYETAMPNADTQPLFDEARRLGIGFCLGYALKDADGRIVSEGDARLSDSGYLQGSGLLTNSDPLRYEKRLIDDWVKRQLASQATAAR